MWVEHYELHIQFKLSRLLLFVYQWNDIVKQKERYNVQRNIGYCNAEHYKSPLIEQYKY